MPHDVFISHASRDAATAQAVLAAVEARGVRCWIAPRDITPGREWEPSIMAALAASRAVVLVFSGAANASAHVRREVAAAADAGVPVVPYRVDRAEMEQALRYYLAGVHWLDAVSGPPERNLAALADTVETLLDREPAQNSGSPPPRSRRRIRTLFGIAAVAAGLATLSPLVSWPVPTRAVRLDMPPPNPVPTRDLQGPSPPPAEEAAPEAMVRTLYQRGAALDGVPASLLTPALREAERNRVDDEERGDWRYAGGEPPPFADLAFGTAATGPLTAETRVRWGGFPRRREVTYALCRLPDGRWRIADVVAEGRSLRQLDGLPPPDPLNGC